MEHRRRPAPSRGSIPRSGTRFRADPRVPDDHQTLDPVYADNRLDRGHVARRADLLWGPLDEALEANSDSFFFPNITPQMDDFNQERLGGGWGMLEAAILSDEGLRPRRLSLFGGPVLADDDPPYRDLVRIPREHWKVVVYRLEGVLRFRCFLLTQQIDPGRRCRRRLPRRVRHLRTAARRPRGPHRARLPRPCRGLRRRRAQPR